MWEVLVKITKTIVKYMYTENAPFGEQADLYPLLLKFQFVSVQSSRLFPHPSHFVCIE